MPTFQRTLLRPEDGGILPQHYTARRNLEDHDLNLHRCETVKPRALWNEITHSVQCYISILRVKMFIHFKDNACRYFEMQYSVQVWTDCCPR